MAGEAKKAGQVTVRAIGVCPCGNDAFKIKIYENGQQRYHCLKCDEIWEAPDKEKMPKESLIGSMECDHSWTHGTDLVRGSVTTEIQFCTKCFKVRTKP